MSSLFSVCEAKTILFHRNDPTARCGQYTHFCISHTVAHTDRNPFIPNALIKNINEINENENLFVCMWFFSLHFFCSVSSFRIRKWSNEKTMADKVEMRGTNTEENKKFWHANWKLESTICTNTNSNIWSDIEAGPSILWFTIRNEASATKRPKEIEKFKFYLFLFIYPSIQTEHL